MNCREFYFDTEDGLRLFGRDWTPGTNPDAAVCLVHGLGEHSGRYAQMAETFVRQGFALAAFDLRGHGKSPGKRGHSPNYQVLLNDIQAFIGRVNQFYPNSPIYLYGHSLGGNLVVNYVLRKSPQLAGVIVTSPWLQLAFEPPGLQVKMAMLMNRIWPGLTLANGLQTGALSHDPEVVQAYTEDALVHNRISVKLFLSAYKAGKWALENAASFGLPLLLMHGSEDRITASRASERFASAVPGDCTFKLWNGLYHELHNEIERESVLAFILTWLKNQLSRNGKPD